MKTNYLCAAFVAAFVMNACVSPHAKKESIKTKDEIQSDIHEQDRELFKLGMEHRMKQQEAEFRAALSSPTLTKEEEFAARVDKNKTLTGWEIEVIYDKDSFEVKLGDSIWKTMFDYAQKYNEVPFDKINVHPDGSVEFIKLKK